MPCFNAILLICIILSGCGTGRVDEAETPDAKEPILEVVTSATGAVYPKEGDILLMRLFADGRFEYDDFPDYDPPRWNSGNVTVTRRAGRLDAGGAKELTELARQHDFLSANEEYPQQVPPGVDTRWDLTIKFKQNGIEKRIFALDFWRTPDSAYPPSLGRLVARVQELKSATTGNRSKQWVKPVKTAGQ